MSMEKSPLSWHVAHTAPRAEKKVHARLEGLGYECYCPLSRVRRKWSDRMKWVYEPVFRSYVFVRIPRADMPKTLQVPGLVRFLFHEGQPAVVREGEIDIIRRFLLDFEGVSSRPITEDDSETTVLEPGSKVRVLAGMLMGHEGLVLRMRNNQLIVRITSLDQELVASIDPELIGQ